jgi:acyl-CoA synthetase (NDP forming)
VTLLHAPTTPDRLAGLFRPSSVALVGATDRSPWSVYTYANLATHSPDVTVHVVHPGRETVHGQATSPSLTAIGEPVDLAFIMVPTEATLEVVAEAADVGIRNVVILTAGFSEAGPHGAELEAALVDLARKRDLTILGPNGNGFVNAAAAVTPYGLPISPPLVAGPVGVVLQSGALASGVLAGAQARGIGVSTLVSTGNEALVSATDIMRWLIADPDTAVVAAFLESIRQPEEFRTVAEEALAAGKPLVVLKVGRSEAGSRTALAHTGALAGDDRVISAAFSQLGVVRVNSLEELLSTAGYLGHHPGVRGRRLAAITPSGGACDILADRASDEGLELPEFDDPTLARLGELLPPFSTPHNPLDVTGYVVIDPDLTLRSLEIVGDGAAGRFDLILYAATVPRVAPPDPVPLEARWDQLTAIAASSPVPVVLLSSLSADLGDYATELLGRRGLFVVDGIDQGLRAIGHAARYHERRGAWLATARPSPAPPTAAPAGSTGVWPEHRVRNLLERAGIPLVPARLVTSRHEAELAAAELGVAQGAAAQGTTADRTGLVVLKVASPDLPHKTEAGGVRLGVAPAEAGATYDDIVTTVGRSRPSAVVDGVLVAPMRRPGIELLVGVTTEPGWGQVLTVGLGGIWVEVLGDVALRILPVRPADVHDMLSSLRGFPLLTGARGATPADLDVLAGVIHNIAVLAEGLRHDIDVLEVNPIRVDGGDIEVLDALAIWRP